MHPTLALPRSFQFLDPGPLIDGELELVRPDPRWFDEVLAACTHALTIRDLPAEAKMTRQLLNQFLRVAPGGREPGDGADRAPQYHFWMRVRDAYAGFPFPPVRIAGGIGLRVGTSRAIEMYYGNLGYHVYPPAQGRHFAERSCRLLLPLARAHGMRSLWITCNPDNFASRVTCERLGATLVSIVPVPTDDPLYTRGEREKCRYRIDL